MQRARVFALSSRYEGLPNVLIEAMAVGTPVVSTACGGADEILESGRLGPIVPLGDAVALGEALARVLRAPVARELLIESAGRFASEAVAARYLEAMGLT
jgi:glycosyltransferase involved in cell wall biosynthesis